MGNALPLQPGGAGAMAARLYVLHRAAAGDSQARFVSLSLPPKQLPHAAWQNRSVLAERPGGVRPSGRHHP